jgi:hypothetical protein
MSLELAKTFLERALSRRDNITAKIRQTGSFATQQCRVLDISRKSARLKVADPDTIPDSFLLSLSNGGPVYHASVTWRRGTEVGAELSARPPRPLK